MVSASCINRKPLRHSLLMHWSPCHDSKNLATECCVTNRAEVKVVGWKVKHVLDNNKLHLNTVFVELLLPPTTIQLDELPLNVVPMQSYVQTVKCLMLNGNKCFISCTQVPLVSNFAMTDYCSQGCNRLNRVVDINNCKNHFSIYTCLS